MKIKTQKGLEATRMCVLVELEKRPSLLRKIAKKIMPMGLIICICLNSMGLSACGQTRLVSSDKERRGNVVFVAPKGWERVEVNGQIIYVAPGSNEKTVITLLPGEALYGSGSLRAWFEAFLLKSQKGRAKVEGGEIQQASSDEGYEVIYCHRIMKTPEGSLSYEFYVATHPGNRVEVVALISTDLNQFKQYQETFQAFIKSIDFANINSSSSRSDKSSSVASNSSNALNGLYVGTISRQQFNPSTKYYDYIVRQQYYLFGSKGKVYFGLPNGNIRDIDQACQQDASNCGEYLLSGSQLQLFRQGQQTQTFNLTRTDNGFKLGNNRFYPINSFDGLKLNGTYSFRSFVNLSGGAGGVSGGLSGERSITFNSEGRFSANNFVGFSASGGVGGAASTTTSSGQGRYEINENTLSLIYSNGQREQFSFFVYPENEQQSKPELIVIGGVAYLFRN